MALGLTAAISRKYAAADDPTERWREKSSICTMTGAPAVIKIGKFQ
jgi:hypothetical protein